MGRGTSTDSFATKPQTPQTWFHAFLNSPKPPKSCPPSASTSAMFEGHLDMNPHSMLNVFDERYIYHIEIVIDMKCDEMCAMKLTDFLKHGILHIYTSLWAAKLTGFSNWHRHQQPRKSYIPGKMSIYINVIN